MTSKPPAIADAIHALRNGEVIAYPTETVFGLGCDPNNASAVQRILDIKQRPIEKGLIVIAGELSQLDEWVDVAHIQKEYPQVIDSWQADQPPTTWCVPCKTSTPKCLTGAFDTLAVRVSQNTTVKALCEALGTGIVSTSANPTGFPPAHTTDEAQAYFPELVVVDGVTQKNAHPSVIKDARTGNILRA